MKPRTVYTLLTTIVATLFWLNLFQRLAIFNPIIVEEYNLTYYWLIGISIEYILVGNFLANTKQHGLAKFLQAFGVFGILLFFFLLMVFENRFWDIIYPVILFVAMNFSITIRSRWFLVFGMLFTFFYILHVTNRYFSNLVGWPVSLIFIGLFIIGLGFAYLKINERYFKK